MKRIFTTTQLICSAYIFTASVFFAGRGIYKGADAFIVLCFLAMVALAWFLLKLSWWEFRGVKKGGGQ